MTACLLYTLQAAVLARARDWLRATTREQQRSRIENTSGAETPETSSVHPKQTMPPKLTPTAITRTLEELDAFTQRNAATLADRNGIDVLTSLRQHHNQEECRFYQFLYKNASRLTDGQRRQLANAFAHVVEARAAAAVPTVPGPPCAPAAARKRPQNSEEPAPSPSGAAASLSLPIASASAASAAAIPFRRAPPPGSKGTAASSKASLPKRAKKAMIEPAMSPAEPHAEGAARKRPRRDAEGFASATNASTDARHGDTWLPDWIDALAWLETRAAEMTASIQVRRLRQMAATLGKQPLTRAALKEPCQHFHIQTSQPQGPRPLVDVHRDCMRAFLRACNDIRRGKSMLQTLLSASSSTAAMPLATVTEPMHTDAADTRADAAGSIGC